MADNTLVALARLLAEKATTPLVPQIQEGWKGLADLVDDPSTRSENPLLARLRGFGAGAMEGIGDVAGSMTSPLGLATMTAGPAMRGLKGMRAAAGELLPAVKPGGGAAVPRASTPPTPQGPSQPPNLPPEFTAVGAEPPIVRPSMTSPDEAVYQRILQNKGAAPTPPPPPSLSPMQKFYADNPMTSGHRNTGIPSQLATDTLPEGGLEGLIEELIKRSQGR